LTRQRPGEPVDIEFARLLTRIENEVAWLDTRFKVPATRTTFGWDPLIGIVPLVGDAISAFYGLRLVAWAHRFGLGPALTIRMLGNVAIDLSIGIIPFAGTIFDVFYRSNLRNLALLLAELDRQLVRDRTRGPS
jgi:hypothetical protein